MRPERSISNSNISKLIIDDIDTTRYHKSLGSLRATATISTNLCHDLRLRLFTIHHPTTPKHHHPSTAGEALWWRHLGRTSADARHGLRYHMFLWFSHVRTQPTPRQSTPDLKSAPAFIDDQTRKERTHYGLVPMSACFRVTFYSAILGRRRKQMRCLFNLIY